MNKRELNGKSPNRHGKYVGDTRYEKVWEQMQLLGIKDITTERQYKNGTIAWRLPIKNEWPGNQENATFIEVASFKTGYVRNQNSGYSNYQLNNKKKIPIEIDRLEYLISYCLKNYYIKRANQVVDGEYVPKWKNEADKSEQFAKGFGHSNERTMHEVTVIIDGHKWNLL